jgi:hypothetical protein
MVVIPEQVVEDWHKREDPAVLTTVNSEGSPNTIYVGAVRLLAEDRFVIADSAFCKTRENILAGSPASFLFISKEGAAYQVKGRFEYYTEGKVFDSVLEWADPQYEVIGATVVVVEEVYKGAEKLAG